MVGHLAGAQHDHIFSLLQRAHCLLLPQIGNNQAHSTLELFLEDACGLLAIGIGSTLALA